MHDVGELLAHFSRGQLRPVVEAGMERFVRSVSLAETLADVQHAQPDAIVLLTRAASADATTYRFDVALRHGAERGMAAVALTADAAETLPRSPQAICERGHVGLLAYASDVDLAELGAAIGAVLSGDAQAAIQLAGRGIRALDAGRASHAGVEVTLAAVREALPRASVGEPGDGLMAEPVEVDGLRECWLVAPEGGAVERLLLRCGAADLAAAIARTRREQDAPIRSRSELLTELLATEPGRDVGLLRRARALGLAVDAWHTVVLVGLEQGPREDPVDHEERRRVIERVALGAARSASGTWHIARSEGHIVLLRTGDTEPGAAGAAAVLAAARAVLAALEERWPDRAPRAGVGGSHQGPTGLRASAVEARAALAGSRAGQPPSVFDASGLQAMLGEWYATDSARRFATSLLEPLDRLGPRRSQEAIRTLQVFLEEQGSVTRAARRLHLHRNAVSYRVRQIFDALEVERDDPDTLLALQLACRSRALSQAIPAAPRADEGAHAARTGPGKASR
jgi:sugar diacid utilization regulator